MKLCFLHVKTFKHVVMVYIACFSIKTFNISPGFSEICCEIGNPLYAEMYSNCLNDIVICYLLLFELNFDVFVRWLFFHLITNWFHEIIVVFLNSVPLKLNLDSWEIIVLMSFLIIYLEVIVLLRLTILRMRMVNQSFCCSTVRHLINFHIEIFNCKKWFWIFFCIC